MTPDQESIDKRVFGVIKIYLACQDAYNMYEGVSKHAEKINRTSHVNFFAAIQKMSLMTSAIELYKLFDTKSPRNKKHTVIELVKFLKCEAKFSAERDLNIDLYNKIEMDSETFAEIKTKCLSEPSFNEGVGQLADFLRAKINSAIENDKFKMIQKFRDTIGAHADRLSDNRNIIYRTLPGIEHFEKFTELAWNITMIVNDFLLSSSNWQKQTRCMRRSTLNVVRKILGKPETYTSAGINEFFSR